EPSRLLEISNLCANSLKMSRRDRSYFGAGGLSRPPRSHNANLLPIGLFPRRYACLRRHRLLACLPLLKACLRHGAACARPLPNKFVKVAPLAATAIALIAILPEI